MAKKTQQRDRGLGRGLSALLADVDLDRQEVDESTKVNSNTNGARMIPIEHLEPNKNQPRRNFNGDDLTELAASIGEKGIVQPIIVRSIGEDKYQIVAGERRWRAAQKAKLHLVPVLVKDYSDVEVQEIALIENIQRRDLNVMEEAAAYNALMKEHGHTQEKLSKALGKSRSHIANILRLLNLPQTIQAMVSDNELSMGHARALLASDDPKAAANHVVKNNLSVRELETYIRQQASKPSNTPKENSSTISAKDADAKQLEQELSAALGMRLHINHFDNNSGNVKINYKDLDELDRICKLLGK